MEKLEGIVGVEVLLKTPEQLLSEGYYWTGAFLGRDRGLLINPGMVELLGERVTIIRHDKEDNTFYILHPKTGGYWLQTDVIDLTGIELEKAIFKIKNEIWKQGVIE